MIELSHPVRGPIERGFTSGLRSEGVYTVSAYFLAITIEFDMSIT